MLEKKKQMSFFWQITKSIKIANEILMFEHAFNEGFRP